MHRYGNKFGECSISFKSTRRNSEYLPVITEIIPAFQCKPIIQRINGRIECNPVSRLPSPDIFTCFYYHSRRLMSHNEWWDPSSGTAIETMYIRSADATCFNLNQHLVGFYDRVRYIFIDKLIIFFEHECLHIISVG